jgi:hypothetical protein
LLWDLKAWDIIYLPTILPLLYWLPPFAQAIGYSRRCRGAGAKARKLNMNLSGHDRSENSIAFEYARASPAPLRLAWMFLM